MSTSLASFTAAEMTKQVLDVTESHFGVSDFRWVRAENSTWLVYSNVGMLPIMLEEDEVIVYHGTTLAQAHAMCTSNAFTLQATVAALLGSRMAIAS